MEKNFKFHLPLEVLEKAVDANGKEVMKIGGIASTSAKDADGEFLDPQGFDLSYFKSQGFFNWHHMSKKDPTAIIGEPTSAKITKDGLYVEGFLYSDSPIAKSVFSTAQMLEKSSNNRRLGFSIEGKATQRRSEDEQHPDFKYVERASITGCAITFMPKNPKTYMDLIKGGVDDDYEEDDIEDDEVEKMLTAGSTSGTETTNKTDQSGAPLKKESVGRAKNTVTGEDALSYEQNGGKNTILSKSDLIKSIMFHPFGKVPGISLNTAEKVGNFIIKSFDMKSNEVNLKESDLEKALDKLETAMDHISKAKSSEDEEADDDDYSDDMDDDKAYEKACGLVKTMCKAGCDSKSTAMNALIKKGYSAKISKMAASEVPNYSIHNGKDEKDIDLKKALGELSELKKGMESITNLVNDKNYSVGVILKGIYDSVLGMDDRVESLEKGIQANTLNRSESDGFEKGGSSEELSKAISIFSAVSEKLEGFEGKLEGLEKALNAPNPRKSIRSRPVERNFNDGNSSLQKGGDAKQIQLSNKKGVLEVLDKAAFEKGYDHEYADAMMSFENGNEISSKVVQRLASERNTILV
jgi:hypothetical protein